MTPLQSLLVESLGFLDALWEPIRDHSSKSWPATWVLRWRLRGIYGGKAGNRSGLPYRGAGDMATSRALTEAACAGLVIRSRGQKKTTSLVLTPAGIRAAREAIGDHPHVDVFGLDEVLRHSRGTDCWVPETALNDGRGWEIPDPEGLKRAVGRMIPALTSGLVESNCLMQGQACYRAAAPRPDVPEAELDADPPEAAPGAFDHYQAAYRDGLAWLDAQTEISVGARGEIGALFLPPFCLMHYATLPGSVLPRPIDPDSRPASGRGESQ